MTGRQADEHTSSRFTIEEVTDLGAMWPEIEELILDLIRYHEPWDARTLRADWSSRMREFMATRGVTLVARESSGRAIGLLNGDVANDFGIYDEVAGHINNAFVRENARRGGVGAALVDAFEAWCRGQGASEVRLEVAAGNEIGSGFWHKAGYAVTMHEMRKTLEAST